VKAGLLFKKIFNRLKQKPFIYDKRLIFEYSMSAQINPISPKLPVEFGFGSTGNVNKLVTLPKTNENGHNEQEIYVDGTIEGKEVYHLRISLDRVAMIRLLPCCHVSEKTAFFYDGYTDPHFRGNGIFSAGLNFSLRYLQSHGFEKVYLRTHPMNTSSIRGAERVGFRLIGKAYHLSFFGTPLKPFGRATSGS
jgi:GNAT superfamily N-acetyltransferase